MTPVEKRVAAFLIFFLILGLSLRLVSARSKHSVRIVSSPQDQPVKTFKEHRPKPSKVELNRATLDDLIALPKIGPSLAKRILEARKSQGSFQDKRDLLKIPGIKEGIYRAIEPHITLDPK